MVGVESAAAPTQAAARAPKRLRPVKGSDASPPDLMNWLIRRRLTLVVMASNLGGEIRPQKGLGKAMQWSKGLIMLLFIAFSVSFASA
jgi:hypothetical protein